MLSIGHLSISIPAVLSPISGVSDLPFRMLNRFFGAPLAFTEMVDSRALSLRDRRTMEMLVSGPDDRPLGVQLLSADKAHIIESLDVLDAFAYDLVDLNAACPAPKVVRRGKGAALLKEPGKLEEILKLLVRYARTPVTIKIRSGWDDRSVNAREVALRAEDAGVSAIFIHGRTRAQGYSGTVDYATIEEVKRVVNIPVIASGDNLTLYRIREMFERTGCDGVAIARGSFGNPWLFREVKEFFCEGSPTVLPSVSDRVEVMKRHLSLLVEHYGEKRAVSVFRKFFIWYTRGMRNTRMLRDRAFRTEVLSSMVALVEEFKVGEEDG